MNLSAEIERIARLSEHAIPIEAGDYIGEDGLYYCKKCNTPKQCRVKNPFVEGQYDVRSCMCKCRSEEKRRREEEEARIEFEKRVKEHRRIGFPEERMQYWTFANDDHANEKISNVARNYFDNFDRMRKDGKGLLLFGECGVGKTYFAACIVNALIDQGIPCLMTNFPRLVNTIGGMFDGKQEYIDNLNRFPLLVVDDLASERDTEYMNEIIFNIVDSRYRAGLPIIITTNLTAQEIKAPSETRKQRIFSRLLEMCLPVEVKGTDRRRDLLKSDFGTYKEILGL